MYKKIYFRSLLGFLLAVLLFQTDNTVSAQLNFNRTIIDSTIGGDVKMVADIDLDGFKDVLIGGFSGEDLNWYHYPTWTKTVIAAIGSQFTTDAAVADIDGDGDIDVVAPDDNVGGNNLSWYENPRISPGGVNGNPFSTANWTRRVIGSTTGLAKDVELSDFDSNGLIDIAIRTNGGVHIWFQTALGVWNRHNFSISLSGEGMGSGDIDGDGDSDLVLGGFWLRNPSGINSQNLSLWSQFTIGSTPSDFKALVANIDADSAMEILFSNSELSAEDVVWFDPVSGDPTGTWQRHVIATAIDGAHTLQAADMDMDGDLDVIVGQMHTTADKEIAVYINTNGLGTLWNKFLIDNQTGIHNGVVADIGNDGDFDIFGANWAGNSPVSIWENITPTILSVGPWTPITVSTANSQTFGLAFGDVNSDGLKDVISGRYWYRNPGGGLTNNWTQSSLFPNSVDAVLVTDVDGDMSADIITQKTEGQNLALYWLESQNTSGSLWNSVTIGTVPAASHPQGAQGHRVAQIRPGGKSEILTSSGNGIWYFEVPSNPTVNPWTRVQISSNPSDEGFAVVDVDRDGQLDVIAGTGGSALVQWYKNPGTGAGNWTSYTIGNTSDFVFADRFESRDLNNDGRADIVATEENISTSGAKTVWWEQPSDPTQSNWVRRIIATQASTHSLDINDLDKDGDNDIVIAEHKGNLDLDVWLNDGLGSFTESNIDTNKESHLGGKTIDIDGDGDLDIVSIAWDNPGFVYLWRNDANTTSAPPDTTAPIISGVGTSNVFSSNATIQWTTNEPATDMVEYGLTASYGLTTPISSSLTSSHSVIISGLSSNTTYHYRVISMDGSGNTTSSGDFSFTTAISNPSPSGIFAHWKLDEVSGTTGLDSAGNGFTATLQNGPTWTTGQLGGAVNFNGSNQYISTPNIDVSGAAMTITTWVNFNSFPTNSDARFISKATNIYENDHYWMLGQTNNGNNRLRFRLKTAGNTSTLIASSGNLTTNTWYHSAAVYDGSTMRLYLNGVEVGSMPKTGLISTDPSVLVNIARNPDGSNYLNARLDDVRIYNRALSANEVVDVMSDTGVDLSAPVRSNGLPSSTLPETSTSTSISLTSNENAICRYMTLPGSAYDDMTNTFSVTGGLNHSSSVNVSAGGAYSFYVRCIDTAGNVNTDDFVISFNVDEYDVSAPNVSITSPTEGATVAGTINLLADATDNRSISRVDFYVDGVIHSMDTTTPYSAVIDTTILPDGGHELMATAFDTAGNYETDSIGVIVQNADIIPPSTPSNVSTSVISSTQINLSWNASTDNISVSGYRIFRDGLEITTTTLLSYSDTALSPATTYNYSVAAFDAAGNQSPLSTAIQATTLTPDTTSPVISNVIPSAVTANSATISWSTNELSDSQIDYGLTSSYGLSTVLDSSPTLSHSQNLLGLLANSTYHFRVKSRDSAGNITNSSDFTFTTQNTPTISGLVAKWNLDEGSGTTAADESGNNHIGTLVNGPLWTQAGRIGGALTLDGNNDYVNVGNFDVSGNAITISGWVLFNSLPTNIDQRILSKANNSTEDGHYWMLGHAYSGNAHRLRFRLRTNNNTSTLIASSGNLVTNTWYHATAVYNGSTMKLYLNGVEVGSSSKTGPISTNSSVNVNLGRNPGGSGNPFRGTMDDVRIYNRALTSQEIIEVMNGN